MDMVSVEAQGTDQTGHGARGNQILGFNLSLIMGRKENWSLVFGRGTQTTDRSKDCDTLRTVRDTG